MPQPPALPVRTPARPEPDVAQIVITFRYTNGAVREYTADQPLYPRLAIMPSENPAGLGPGLASEQRSEAQLAVFLGGNPDAGGIQVHSEGVAP